MPATSVLVIGQSGGSGYLVGDTLSYDGVPIATVATITSIGAVASVTPLPIISTLTANQYNVPVTGGSGTGCYLSLLIATNSTVIYKQPLSYYLNLLTSQYKQSPKLNAMLAAVLQPLDDLTNCLAFIASNYDIDYAFGVQLDVLGQLIGQSRTLSFQPTSGSPVLDDTTYRLLLKARILWNNWDGLLVSLPAIWQSLFPSGALVINDNQNMTCTIIFTGSFTSIILDMIVGFALGSTTSGTMNNGLILPRPEGVEYDFTLATLPILGADQDNAYVAGADLGHAS